MKNPATLFRIAIALEVLSFIGSLLLGFFAPEETNEDILRRIDSGLFHYLETLPESFGESYKIYFLIGMLSAGLILLGGMLTIYIGLFLFWDWARIANLIVFVIGLVLTPFLGWTVMPPIDTTISWLSSTLGGAILAASFLSPIADRFRRHKAEQDAAANP